MLLWLQDLKLRPQAWGSPPSPSVPPGEPGEGLQGPPSQDPQRLCPSALLAPEGLGFGGGMEDEGWAQSQGQPGQAF